MGEGSAVRTRNVKTITSEDLPVDSTESRSLGVPWEEYLAGLSADELAICDVYVYRKEPVATEGYLTKVHEAIDRQWLQERFGGGTFEVTIRNKNGKSHYERNIKIVGEPKLIERERPNAAAAPAADNPMANVLERLFEQNERLMEKLDARNAPSPPAGPSPAQESAVGIMAQAAGEAVKLVAAQVPKGDAAPPRPLMEQLGDIAKLAELFRPKEDPLVAKLLQASIERLLAPPPAPGTAGGLLSEVTQLTQLIAAIDALRGGGGAADWKAMAVQQLGEHIPDIVGGANSIMDKRLAELRFKAETALRLRGAAAPGEPARPAAAPSPGPVLQTPAPPAAGALSAEQIAAFAKRRVCAMFQEGAHGAQIVVMLAGVGQDEIVDMLGKYTAEQIVGFLKSDPILAEIAGDEDFPAVVAEAQEYIRQAKAAAPPVQ